MEEIFTISNGRLEITITNYGGRIMQWLVDKVDIVFGFDTIDKYKTANEPYHSALIGRYANRIANSKFTYNGQSFQLNQNHGKHILHGGQQAFHNAEWTVLNKSKTHIELYHVSPDGDQGFPGELTAIARYEIKDDTLVLSINATTTKVTPLSITYHPYFNLSGIEADDLSNHVFKIHAEEILETNKNGIPTGETIEVKDSGFDFKQWKSLDNAMAESHSQIELLQGIDHTYITECRGNQVQLQAEAKAKNSQVHMQVYSNQPGVQFYTANHFNGSDIGKNDRLHQHRGAFCFEPQMWPDSPNQNNFPSAFLIPNETFSFVTEYKFPMRYINSDIITGL